MSQTTPLFFTVQLSCEGDAHGLSRVTSTLLSTVTAGSCLVPVGAWPERSIPGYIPDMSHVTMMSTLNRTLMKKKITVYFFCFPFRRECLPAG